MAETTNLNIRIDKDLKERAEAVFADMGMSMTTAFNIFAKKTVREYRIPFEIGAEKPNADTLSAIKEVEMMKKDPSLGKSYNSVNDMMEDLLG